MARRIGTPGGTDEQPALFFRDAAEFRAWLEAHHETADELWMGLHKKHVPDGGLTWADAVPEALCFGWIDSRAERIDEDRRRQRWTPRRKGSHWSNVNVALVEQLIAEGRMTPAGLAAYAQRREDRTGLATFENDPVDLSDEHAALLAADPRATAFWEAATPSYRRTCSSWVETAKQQATRDRRMAELVDACAHGRLIKVQAYGDPPRWLERAAAAAASVAPD